MAQIEYVRADGLGLYLPQRADPRLVLPRLHRGLDHPDLWRFAFIVIPPDWHFVEYRRLKLEEILHRITALRWRHLPEANGTYDAAIVRAALLVGSRKPPVVEPDPTHPLSTRLPRRSH
jgi:hypothetical protein